MKWLHEAFLKKWKQNQQINKQTNKQREKKYKNKDKNWLKESQNSFGRNSVHTDLIPEKVIDTTCIW